MPEEIRINRPTVQPGRPDAGMEYRSSGGRGGSAIPWIVLAVVVIGVVLAAVLFRDKLFGGNEKMENKAGESSGYQAVFLTNGQVYFGKMSGSENLYVTLTDIFYLQVQNPPIQGSQQQQAAAQAQPQLSLVKLGNELHGPVDEMHINREQLLFYEDMTEGAKVMQAIKEYKANPPAAAGATPPPTGGTGQTPAAPPAATVTPPPAPRTVTPPPAPPTSN